MGLPGGTVMFLVTDIEGSTLLWEQFPDAMRAALKQHDELLRNAVERHNGQVFKTVGDSFCAVFSAASDALDAALAAQLALAEMEWPQTGPLRVRIALHSGTAERRDNDYFGPAVNRAFRLLATGHGGQTLLSRAAYELASGSVPAGASFTDMGTHRLKDLAAPEHVWQVQHPSLPCRFPPLKSLDYLPTNLPQQPTSFIGREEELEETKALLSRSRLVTLTGSGGCGKTRLAVQAAADVLERYPDGVWLVELAALSDEKLVAQTVAQALNVREAPGGAITDRLLSALRDKRMLVVMDNCEHLVDACARLADEVLKGVAGVTLLATSREALRIGGETTYRVPPLPVPDVDKPGPGEFDSVLACGSVRLFAERATAARREFVVTSENASSVAVICRRLDGIPFALELAAARVSAMSVDRIASRLDSRFRLLTGGSRTALPRQQTLRSLIDWSYDLLTEGEKTLLCRLTVFRGGWSAESAETVCGPDGSGAWEAPDLLTSLVDKSLVVYDDRGGRPRYRLLETVHQYAADRLREIGEADMLKDRHLLHFLALAEEAAPQLTGSEQSAWLTRLETEHDNLRAALEWSAGTGTAPEMGLRLCGSLSRFWGTRGFWAEGRAWCSAALARSSGKASPALASTLTGAGLLTTNLADYPVAYTLHEQSLAVRRELNDRIGVSRSLNNLGIVAELTGDYCAARSAYEEALRIARELDHAWVTSASLVNLGILARTLCDDTVARSRFEDALTIKRELGDRRGIALCLGNLGDLAHRQGDYNSGRALLEESLSISREIGDRRGTAHGLSDLGNAELLEGNHLAARPLLAESLAIRRELGDLLGIAELMESLAAAGSACGVPLYAGRLYGAAERLREEIGAPVPPNERAGHEAGLAAAQAAATDDVAFDSALADGRAMTLEQVIEFALQGAAS